MPLLTHLPATVWHASFHAAVAVAAVLIVRQILRPRLSGRWRLALWALVAIRLLTPWTPASPTSVFALAGPPAEPPAATLQPPAAPSTLLVTTGLLPNRISNDIIAPVAPTPLPSSPPTHLVLVAAAVIWWAGATFLLTRHAVACRRSTRRLARTPETDPTALALLDDCRRRARVRRPVALARSAAVAGPALVGVRRPTILLPPGLTLPPDKLECVLLHELAHVRRHDLLTEHLVALLTALHWFNPLVWLAARCYRADRELARDAETVSLLRRDPDDARQSYARTLLDLIESALSRPAPPAALGLLSSLRPLAERFTMITRPRHRSLPLTLTAFAAVVAVGCTTLTRPPATQPTATGPKLTIEIAADGDVVTRVYDVRDLITPIPDFSSDDDAPAHRLRAAAVATRPVIPAPAFERSPTTPALPGPAAGDPTARLISLIRDTIDPPSWPAAKLPGAQSPSPYGIRELSGQLIVRQTRANHDALTTLLTQLRQTRGIQITVEARFVLFDLDALAKADPAAAALLSDLQHADKNAPLKPAPTYLTEPQLNTILRAAQSLQETTTLSAPRVTTFNGQRAYVKIAHQRAYTADYKITRGPDGKPAYEPVAEVAESGLTLDVQATASADRKYVTLNLRPHIAKLLGLKSLPFPNLPPDHPAGADKPIIQQPDLAVTEVRTTISVPNNQTLVLGGMPDTTGLTKFDDPAVKPKPGHRLFIFVKPTLILQTETDQRSFPLLKSKVEPAR
ncbi:MAG TPA: M56 family metallopeptidase [Tepidisphaeraceae bacterium]|nr:M56 family metallopeptidase [Tepidisphaeraceae bacterium]